MNTINNTLKKIVDALENKKAENIQLIDISEVSTVADYFIITNGTNVSQIQALSDNVEERLAIDGIRPRNIEGYNTANWILMDYNDFLVHIFDRESRNFYDLERIWRDGKAIDVQSL
ncbi:ribosomal silencing factor RsfS [Lachnospiraceae bacterium]|nr:ribosomal silencing factor RsfS [Lachnospiraceae bacterium]